MTSDAPIYVSRKCKLKKILKRKYWNKIEDAVKRTHIIIKNTLQFMKYYYTKKYSITKEPNNIKEPTSDFIKICFNLISNGTSNTRTERVNDDENKEVLRKNNRNNKLNLLDELTNYYDEYSKLFNFQSSNISNNLSQILNYSKDQILTCYRNNIEMNYPKYIKKITNIECKKIYFSYKEWKDDYNPSKQERKDMYKEINKVKNDIFNYNIRTEYTSNLIFHEWLNNIYESYYPKPLKNSKTLYEDLFNEKTNYLGYMIKINLLLEDYSIKLFNPLCLRNSNIPKYIKIDTTALTDILVDEFVLEDLRFEYNCKKLVKADLFSNIDTLKLKYPQININALNSFDYKTEFWKFFCKFDSNKHSRNLLKSSKYVFDNSIMTDGFGVSVLQIRKDRIGTNCKSNKKKIIIEDCDYLDELTHKDLEYIKNSTNVVVIDPGKKNILYISDGQKEGKHLRYTYQQRRRETRTKQNKQELIMMKQENKIDKIENNIKYNSKSCKLEEVIKYIKENKEFVDNVNDFYHDIKHREMRYRGQKHTKISEEKLITNIKKTFETDKPLTLVYGNWSCRKQLRNFAPTPGIGLRRKLARTFNVYLLDEYCTSCKCAECHKETDYTKPREYEKNGEKKTVNVHSLLRCQNEECSKLWNRDVNATVNQYHLTMRILNNENRPKAFMRNQ